jgi:hypothetical protein
MRGVLRQGAAIHGTLKPANNVLARTDGRVVMNRSSSSVSCIITGLKRDAHLRVRPGDPIFEKLLTKIDGYARPALVGHLKFN